MAVARATSSAPAPRAASAIAAGAGEGVLARAGELGPGRRDTGALVGAAVDPQEASRAVAIEAEEAARAVVLRRAGQRVDSGGVQRHGHWLAREGGNGRPFE